MQVEGAYKTLDQAKKAHEAHMNDIQKLEDELAEVDKAKAEYEEQIAGESQSQVNLRIISLLFSIHDIFFIGKRRAFRR